jgi:replicative DNA helicase
VPDDYRATSPSNLIGLSQRLPPSNAQAEQSLLGAILADNRAFDHVASFLRPEHFADPVHAKIYEAAGRRIRNRQIADAITLKAEFENAGTLDEIGGVSYLAQLLTAMVGIITAKDYGRAVHDCWLRRQLIELADGLVGDAFCPDERSGSAIAAQAVENLLGLTAMDSGAGFGVSMSRAAEKAFQSAQAAHRGEAGHRRIDTGIRTFDAVWGGLYPGQLYYLAARSRTGKTPAAAQIARNVARRFAADPTNPHVHFVSLEETDEDLVTTMLVQVTKWTAEEIRSGSLRTAEDWLELERHRQAIGLLPIVIDAPPQMTMTQIDARARVVKRTRNTGLVIIDHRQIIHRDKEQSRMDERAWASYTGGRLKALAKALRVPVIVLNQINKAKDASPGRRPILADLPYCNGADADAVFCLWRRELDMEDEPPDFSHLTEEKAANAKSLWYAGRNAAKGRAEFGALKRRFGQPMWRKMMFDGPSTTFIDDEAVDEIPY